MAAHSEDYQSAGANFAVSVPSTPSRLQHTGAGETPFGDSVLSAIGADQNADRSKWGAGVTVAVLDSGVGAHPAFFDGQVIHVDLVNDGKPFNGHGTAMASLIAGNVGGAQGVAPATTILDVRIADATGVSDSFMLAKGIETAVNRGAQIINISMGSYGDSPLVAQAVQNALAKGIVVVASAGNDQASTKAWPAAYPGVVSVSGVYAAGKMAYFSNTGDPTLSAPAVGIPSDYEKDSQPLLAQGDGTSQAAALVSGAAAAIRGAGSDALKVLTNNALNTGLNSHEGGAGMLRLPAKLR
jgi:thermitase